ncbi:nucleoside diphosphate-linked moiety x motif 19 [Plakobranchus ocellatus]|uniref:Nucleoside diphosphate-linked moiety x motif 19 n=1 Tax=Plakobranchus ocellatus TaxID=259542 RepID=A0AAV3ZUY7_9GAST|nr:nucleoside diphosphate-linked moiety x motif 19 [Plakobranchus ocellatus]
MQFKKRLLTLTLMCTTLALAAYLIYTHGILGGGSEQASNAHRRSIVRLEMPEGRQMGGGLGGASQPGSNQRSFLLDDIPGVFAQDAHPNVRDRSQGETAQDWRKCHMETCFDFDRCKNGFKVYLYPRQVPVSAPYAKILSVIERSRYLTANPHEACVFIPSIDTLDQDVLSKDYVPDVGTKLRAQPYWNGGRNHIMFNQYSGTWPDYGEELKFIEQGILVKSSMSIDWIRYGFDISMPLFAKNHPQSGGEMGYLHNASNSIPSIRHYLLAFKGKRYLNGVGSDTRNVLYHIHNAEDIVLLTTCKHGKGWEKLADERCYIDNEEYDKFDYQKLLFNSTFCLVPRGRRLGSFRFLESLQATCIPILLSNSYELPFSEVIDWNKIVIWGDERLLFQVPPMVRSVPQSKILALRQQNQLVWESYFRSVDAIINTVLEIVKNRVARHLVRPSYHWNSVPGAHVVLPEWSDIPNNFPFYYKTFGETPGDHFTAIIYATSAVTASSPLFRVLKMVAKSQYCKKIIVLWNCDVPPPPSSKWPTDLGVPVRVKTRDVHSLNARFLPFKEIETDAVFNFDEDVLITTDEVDFAFGVWLEFADRIVGYPARSHYWDEALAKWIYTSKWTNQFSMILPSAAIYHKYYNYLYHNFLNPLILSKVEEVNNCEDILMNFVVAHATRLPPIKLTQRKAHKPPDAGTPPSAVAASKAVETDQLRFQQRQECLEAFVENFGYMPLIHSSMRMDTMLYKDPVSNMRKKYRQIETVNS